MPETTPLIKAALNLRVGAGFDVYDYIMYGEEHSLKNSEKIYCILNQLEAEQTIKIQFILKMLIEICDAM